MYSLEGIIHLFVHRWYMWDIPSAQNTPNDLVVHQILTVTTLVYSFYLYNNDKLLYGNIIGFKLLAIFQVFIVIPGNVFVWYCVYNKAWDLMDYSYISLIATTVKNHQSFNFEPCKCKHSI